MNERAQKIKEITEQIDKGITNLFSSDKYKNYLNVMSKFYQYSLNNQVLIFLQKPDASFVAGYKSWQNNFHRQVKKGEKGLRILAPCPIKIETQDNEEDKKTITKMLFKPVNVFDLSQTDGEPLPSIVGELEGDVQDYDLLFNVLKSHCPVPIIFDDIKDANGYYHLIEKKIVIKNDLSKKHTIKTLIHEMSHQKLHADIEQIKKEGKSKSTLEVEAESVAYTVCKYFGIDVSDYSFGYVASWSKDKNLSELKNSLTTIQTTAHEFIDVISNSYDLIRKEKRTSEVDKQEEPELE